MSQFVINIPDDQTRFFQELLRNLPWAEIKEVKGGSQTSQKPLTKQQQAWVAELKHALQQVEQHQRGEIKLKSACELLDEL